MHNTFLFQSKYYLFIIFFAYNVLCLLYNVWKNINKEKYDDMCATLSLPSTNTPSALTTPSQA